VRAGRLRLPAAQQPCGKSSPSLKASPRTRLPPNSIDRLAVERDGCAARAQAHGGRADWLCGRRRTLRRPNTPGRAPTAEGDGRPARHLVPSIPSLTADRIAHPSAPTIDRTGPGRVDGDVPEPSAPRCYQPSCNLNQRVPTATQICHSGLCHHGISSSRP
jgi:hypothetical protein